jgi:hypothetical protein
MEQNKTFRAEFSYVLGDVDYLINVELDRSIKSIVSDEFSKRGMEAQFVYQETDIDKPQYLCKRVIGFDVTYTEDIVDWQVFDDIRVSVSIKTKHVVKSSFNIEFDSMVITFENRVRDLCELILSVRSSEIGNAQYLSQLAAKDIAMASADSAYEMIGILELAKAESKEYWDSFSEE